MIKEVHISTKAKKELKKVPTYVVTKLIAWIESVENEGLAETRKIKG